MVSEFDMIEYHLENPEIFVAFEKFTLEAIKSGRTYFGSKAIIERVRWYTAVEAKKDTFKINNNIAPFLSRLFEKKYPEYKGFFRKRISRIDY